MGCAPVVGPNGIDVLLYVGMRSAGALEDRAMRELEHIAELASVGLYHIAARTREREQSRTELAAFPQ
jgi:hypothetical protein